MNRVREEIFDIPARAQECYARNHKVKLPYDVPYLGMGASYFAPLTLASGGCPIEVQLASEYIGYHAEQMRPTGVFISQSGNTSELVWGLDRFKSIIAITNDGGSTIARSPKTKMCIELFSGEEEGPATKTYINTLVVLYLGLGFDPREALYKLDRSFDEMDEPAKALALQIVRYRDQNDMNGLYILGSGPNIPTAYEGALALAETTKLPWIGMPVAQFDHGPKETADNSVVIFLNGNGKDRGRIAGLSQKLQKSTNALVLEISERTLPEMLTPFSLVTQLYLLTDALANELGITTVYKVGSKVITLDNAEKPLVASDVV